MLPGPTPELRDLGAQARGSHVHFQASHLALSHFPLRGPWSPPNDLPPLVKGSLSQLVTHNLVTYPQHHSLQNAACAMSDESGASSTNHIHAACASPPPVGQPVLFRASCCNVSQQFCLSCALDQHTAGETPYRIAWLLQELHNFDEPALRMFGYPQHSKKIHPCTCGVPKVLADWHNIVLYKI